METSDPLQIALVGINLTGQTGAAPGVVEKAVLADNVFGTAKLKRIQLVGVQSGVARPTLAPASGATELKDVTVSGTRFEDAPDPRVSPTRPCR